MQLLFLFGLWCRTPPFLKASEWTQSSIWLTADRGMASEFCNIGRAVFVGGTSPWRLTELDLSLLLNWRKGWCVISEGHLQDLIDKFTALVDYLVLLCRLAECQDWALTDTRTCVPPNLQWGPGSQDVVRHQPTLTWSGRPGFCWMALFPPPRQPFL